MLNTHSLPWEINSQQSIGKLQLLAPNVLTHDAAVEYRFHRQQVRLISPCKQTSALATKICYQSLTVYVYMYDGPTVLINFNSPNHGSNLQQNIKQKRA